MVYPGSWLVMAMVGIILILYSMGIYWAYSHGQFDDVEAAKYAMLENDRNYRAEQD